MGKFRLPTPAMIVALAALFVALSGTAVAATVVVPLAKRALVADNAKKLNGKTAAQIVSSVPAPPPVSTVAGLVAVKTAPWSLNPGQGSDFTVVCDAGQKVLAGGYDNPNGDALGLDTRPGTDGASWRIFLGNLSSSAGASGNLFAVCIK